MNRTNHFFLTFTNKILAGLLSLLGFSLAACDKIGADEYGCPYADYEIKGKVVDENGKAINGIQVIIPDPFGNEEYTHRDTLITNSAGEFVARPVVTTFGTNITFKITTKDIDGTDNGGAFEETITEVAFKKEDLTGGNGEWNYGNAQKNVTIKMKQAVENKE